MVTARSRRTAASEGRLPEVQAPSPDVDIVHTSAVYFIGPGGTERYLAEPMADHASSGAAYLPAGQIAAWGRGIALVARTLSS